MERNTQIRSLDFDSSKSYELLLELNTNSYNYALIDENKALKAIGSQDGNLDASLFSNYNLSKVRISAFSKSYSLVPAHFNQEMASFEKLLEVDQENQSILRKVLNEQINIIYVVDKDLEQSLAHSFPHFDLFPQLNALLKGCQKDGIYINIRGNYVEVLILKAGALNFYNFFEFRNDNELQYFLALVLQQKGFDPKREPIQISGDIAEDSLTFQRIKTLIPNLTLNQPDTLVQIGCEFEKLDLHRYFCLLNLSACE